MDTYPLIAQNGWIAASIPDLFGTGWYVNAQNDTSPVASQSYAVGQDHGTPVYSGYAEQTASLGTTTRLTFTSTVVGGSTLAITGPLATAAGSVGAKSGTGRKDGTLGLRIFMLEAILGFTVLAFLL
jgi:chitin deacetylase